MIASAPSEIEIEAAGWAIRLYDGPLPPAEQTRLNAWLEADSRRRGALLRAQAGYRQLELLRATHDQVPALQQAPRPVLARRNVLAAMGLAAAASIAVVVAPRLQGAGQRFATDRGEVRRVSLEDGSSVVINTDSVVTAAFEPGERRLALVQGEAWFDVKPDKTRPFVVAASGLRVRAVGTAFSVRTHQLGTEVIVTEGVVEVLAEGAKAGARIPAGSKAVFPTRGAEAVVVAVAPQTLEGALAWREGRIVLDGQSLRTAVAEFNRYNARQLVIDGPSGERGLVGVFRANDPEGFAHAIAPLFGADVRASDEKIIINTHGAIIETS
jgi:transmembrane sensor